MDKIQTKFEKINAKIAGFDKHLSDVQKVAGGIHKECSRMKKEFTLINQKVIMLHKLIDEARAQILSY